MKVKTIFILCNGPSLRDVDFDQLRGHDTFAMNLSYREFYRSGFWPKYWACFDNVVTRHHAKEFKKLIEDPKVGIERFFLLTNLSKSEKFSKLQLHGGEGQFSMGFDKFGYGGNTGVNCCQAAMCMGYKRIVVLGADCNYTEIVDGAVRDGNTLVMSKTPKKNPNYWFDDYNRKGDRFNVPNKDQWHLPIWKKLAEFAAKNGVEVINGSPKSKLTCLKKSTLTEQLVKLKEIEAFNPLKKFCVLQVATDKPNPRHVELFSNQKECDFFSVTWKKEHRASLAFCPKSSWAETRNKLVELVPKQYEYYAFVDEDYALKTRSDLNPREQIVEDLTTFNPAVLVPYPGDGNVTPLAINRKYLESRSYSIHAFTHCGLKIVHHSLLKWFFPMVTRFDGWWSASHYFNILELPFIKNIVVTHKLTYANTNNSTSAQDTQMQKRLNMDKMWMWLRMFFTRRHDLRHCKTISNAMVIKSYYVKQCGKKDFKPTKNRNVYVDYYYESQLTKFFDLAFKQPLTTKTLVVVGNGPSLKAEYIKYLKAHPEIHTIGMNGAYRFYKQLGWYPTYFCCYDYQVTQSHRKKWGEWVINPKVPIRKYFFIDADGDCKFAKEARTHAKFVGVPHNQDGLGYPEYGTGKNKMSSTGVNAVRLGAMLGYTRIIVLGCDCRYVQELPGSEKISEWQRQMVTTPEENANYAKFLKGYQQAGDRYNRPGDQLPVWRRLAKLFSKYASKVKVVICSPGTRIDCFRKGDFKEEITK